MHRIYLVKHVPERFRLEIDYSCDFCKGEKETIFHLFFHCIHKKYFVLMWRYLLSENVGHFFAAEWI